MKRGGYHIMKCRLYYIDLFRILACLAVISIHCTAFIMGSIQGRISLSILAVNRILTFAVPAFIFISGYSLYSNYNSKKILIFNFIKKRVSKVLLPYLVWANIYFVFSILKGYTCTWDSYLVQLILGQTSYHLYFIPIIIQFYILFIPLKLIVNKVNTSVVLGGTIIMYLLYHFEIKSILPFSDRFFMTYIPFFILGIYTNRYMTTNTIISKSKQVVVLSLAFIMIAFYALANITYYGYNNPALLRIPLLWIVYCGIVILGLLILCMKIEKYLPKNQLVTLSGVIMTVYFCHPLVITCVNKLINLLYIKTQLAQVLIRLLITIPFSFIFAYLLKLTSGYIKEYLQKIFCRYHIQSKSINNSEM